jgi:gluconolactonase
MRQKEVLTIAACFLGVAVAWGQGEAPPAGAKSSLQAPQDPREPAVLAQCKNPPLPAPDYGHPQLGLRDYKVIEIPGVIAAGQKWKSLWQQMGDNGDGIVGYDGGLLIAQNESSDVLKLDKQGKTSIVYTDTNTGGSLSMNSRGALFIVDRGFNPSISELAPNRKTLADHYQGDPLDCSGVVLNDLTADSKGGAYFTMGGVFYASPSGQITRYDGKNLRGPNGIILSANEKTLYVSNRITLVAFDVQPDGSLTNQRDFGKLEDGGFGDGSAIDAQGRIYVTTAPGVQVIAPDGKYLGLIPTPRPVISVAFSGPDKKTLYVLAQGAKDAQGKEVDDAAQVYSIPMIAQGFKKRAK